MVFIYILKLQQGKYYVGKTDNPQYRLEDHFSEGGSAWTMKYKPIQLYCLIPGCDDYDEDKYTIIYMKKYGIDNVRGGSFCQIKLDESNKETIQRMITGNSDKCYHCGGNHFIKDCNVKKKENTKKTKNIQKSNVCKRCNRTGHTHERCYAKKMYMVIILNLKKNRRKNTGNVNTVEKRLIQKKDVVSMKMFTVKKRIKDIKNNQNVVNVVDGLDTLNMNVMLTPIKMDMIYIINYNKRHKLLFFFVIYI